MRRVIRPLPGDDGSFQFLINNPVLGPSRNPLMCGHRQSVHHIRGAWRHLHDLKACKFVSVVAHHIDSTYSGKGWTP